jgi:hypothetical protein
MASWPSRVEESATVIEDPICEVCDEPMEPIPPVGWVWLSEHVEASASADRFLIRAAVRRPLSRARWSRR